MPNTTDEKFKRFVLGNVIFEEGVDELLRSTNMEPYSRLIKAEVQKSDRKLHLEQIAHLPLERRYVWRITSALKWAFGDFDSGSVAADRETLAPEDLGKLVELVIVRRPIQFCLFLRALVGAENMERLVNEGIAVAKDANVGGVTIWVPRSGQNTRA
jgi:hypothetical protein